MTPPVSGGVPEPAECELEAIAALLLAWDDAGAHGDDDARKQAVWLFERGVRIQDGAALERPRPTLPAPEPPHHREISLSVEAFIEKREENGAEIPEKVAALLFDLGTHLCGAAEHAPPDPNGPIRWCKHEECKGERGTGALPGSEYCVDHDPKLRAWKAIEWAVSLLEIHDGVKVNPNSQWWLAELRAAQTLVDSGPQTGNPPPESAP